METQKFFKVIYKDYETTETGIKEVIKEATVEWNVSKYDDRQSYRQNLHFAALTILDAGFLDLTPSWGRPAKMVPSQCIVQIIEVEQAIPFPPPSFMKTCPDCGNKRCPRAEGLQWKCTNSNELNQTPVPCDTTATTDGSGRKDGSGPQNNSQKRYGKRFRKRSIQGDKAEIIENNPMEDAPEIESVPPPQDATYVDFTEDPSNSPQ